MTLDSMAAQSDISFYTAHKEHPTGMYKIPLTSTCRPMEITKVKDGYSLGACTWNQSGDGYAEGCFMIHTPPSWVMGTQLNTDHEGAHGIGSKGYL